MPKGFCATFCAAALLTAPFALQAQVYRCQTASGIEFSDMPCGDGAEEIVVEGVVMDTRGVGGEVAAPPISEETAEPTDGQAAASLDTEAGSQPVAPAVRPPSAEGSAMLDNPANAGSTNEQYLTDFLAMLKSQRQQQISEIDNQLSALRQQAGDAENSGMANGNQQDLLAQISALENNKVNILSEYEALIAEAEARLQ